MIQGKDSERRTSQRFSMDFKVSIHDVHEDGLSYLEDTALHDVSGVGIGFVSHRPQFYHLGQRLRIVILLPGTDRLDARLEGNATVVRFGPESEDGTLVGASMDDPLEFVSGTHRETPSPDDAGSVI